MERFGIQNLEKKATNSNKLVSRITFLNHSNWQVRRCHHLPHVANQYARSEGQLWNFGSTLHLYHSKPIGAIYRKKVNNIPPDPQPFLSPLCFIYKNSHFSECKILYAKLCRSVRFCKDDFLEIFCNSQSCAKICTFQVRIFVKEYVQIFALEKCDSIWVNFC